MSSLPDMSGIPGSRRLDDAEARCPALDPLGRASHAEAADLRARGPAVLVELPGGVKAWAVTRHSVIRRLTTDPRVSRDFRRHWPGVVDIPEGWALAPVGLQQSFVNTYGEEHRKLRGPVASSFSPHRIQELRASVQATADRLVDAMVAVPPGKSVDARQALSVPLTMTVICDLLGVPHDMRTRLGAAIDAAMDTTGDAEEGVARQGELQDRLARLLAHKREHPGRDLTSDLLAAPTATERPRTEQETLDTLFLMLGAGFETSVNLITNALFALLSHPEHLAALRAGTIGWSDVIEESLRHEGPVAFLPLRYAVEDIDLGEGVLIRRGEPIIIGFAAAGRDPQAHPSHPDEFDPTRLDKSHLAFGYGPHFCLGAHLARLEAHIALATLFERLPDLALARPHETPPRITSFIVNGPTHVDIVPTPMGG